MALDRRTTVSRDPWLGWTVVGFAIVTNIATKVINFSLGEYDTPELSVRAVLNAALGLIYAVCAVVAWRVLPTRMTGWLMVAVSITWQAGSWGRAADAIGWLWPILTAFTHLWAILVGVLVFCYPTGRFTKPFDRGIFLTAVAVFVVRFFSTITLDSEGPEGCDCVPNAYLIYPNPELAQVIENLWQLVGLFLIILVSIRVSIRWLASTPPARRVAFIMPIALISWSIVSILDIGGRVFSIPVPAWFQLFTPIAISIIPIAFVAGIAHVLGLRSRVSDLMVVARDGVDRMVWQDGLRRTLDDRSLKVFWWDDKTGGYLDSEGDPADPDFDEGQPRKGSLLKIDAGDSRLAVINHDVGLTENTRLLDGVAAALRLSVDNDRLRTELEKTLQAIRESRLRIVEAGDQARQRLERDLHDGSQQVLVSVAINLRMIGAQAKAAGDTALGEQLDSVSAQLAQALTELRALARGIHPTALTEGGLRTAVAELAARSPVPVDVEVEFTERAPAVIESTVYFVVAECLTNTAKYAHASRVSVRVAKEAGELAFSITDDGTGMANPSNGSGLRGLTDRVEALGGRLTITSRPGGGTTIRGSLPTSLSAVG